MADDYESTHTVYHKHGLYPLTTLQIGDIQSYLSRLVLRTVCSEKKLILFVDNSPWTVENQRSKPVEFWQLMVTQSRTSPFTNQMQKPVMCRGNSENDRELDTVAAKNSSIRRNKARRKLFQKDQGYVGKLIRDLFHHRLKSVVHVQDLSHQLHGCIAFELEWVNIRGINYVNELQTDTCIAFETKLMLKREFHSFRQALAFYGVNPGLAWSGWFTSAEAKKSMLPHKVQVDNKIDEDCTDKSLHRLGEITTGLCSACSPMEERYQSMNLASQGPGSTGHSGGFSEADDDAVFADCCSSAELPPRLYRDMMILFRFCDPLLPFELQNIITADQRLLKLLESGLPSWAIFLQSYPLVCKVYRPWMCPLARSMYVLVSFITVIIGFYDLYKNVPVLKVTASRICGPLFEWIEAWDMLSRIKYLGTMLFLQNCEKTFRWLIMLLQTVRKLSVMFVKPMIEPLTELAEMLWPIWDIFSDGVQAFVSLVWVVLSSLGDYINNVVTFLIWPIIILLTTVWKLATWLLYPVISAVWGFIVLPIRLVINIVNLLVALACSLFMAAQELWDFVISSAQLISVTGSSAASLKDARSSASAWRILWNDIFSKVFRAVRSIVNGLVAFFAALNRHRLSIYNHTSAFVCQVILLLKSTHSRISDAFHHALNNSLLNEGGFEDEDYCPQYSEKQLTGSALNVSSRQIQREGILADDCMDCSRITLKKD